MARELITDLNDPRIAVYRTLKATNFTRGLGQFVLEGEKLLRRLLASRFPPVSVLATDRFVTRFKEPLPAGVPLYVVPFDQIHLIVGFPFHRGVLACARRTAWPSVEELLRRCDGPCTMIVCPKLSNPENLGAIARIGDAFGVDAILAGPSCPDPLSRRVLRVSMGSTLRLPVIVPESLEVTARRLVSLFDVEFWAAVADPLADSFEQLRRPERLALILGDEDRGVDPDWLARCRQSITIPMRQRAGSLNVAIAAGILLYKLTRSTREP
jgi:tRNA G18 (ribose-2'-O)-methylase SpoU